MIVAEIIRRTDPVDLQSDLDAFLKEKNLGKTDLVSVSLSESELAITAIIVYDDGLTS